jgi:ferrous iron transport protein A
MQLSGNKNGHPTLLDLRRGERGVLGELDLPEGIGRRLMELGFLPGGSVRAGRSAPGGCPRVFEVDGAEVALRCEIAGKIRLEKAPAPPESVK